MNSDNLNGLGNFPEMDFLVCHPVVKVSIVDGATGNLMEKSGETHEANQPARRLWLMTFKLATQFHIYLPWGQRPFSIVSFLIVSVLNVKAVLATFNQEKALVGAFSVIVKPSCTHCTFG